MLLELQVYPDPVRGVAIGKDLESSVNGEGIGMLDENTGVDEVDDAPKLELAPNVVGVVPTLGPNSKVVPVVTNEVVATKEPKENERAEEAMPNPKLVDEVLKLGFDIEN
nr:hypothetical protein Itr_chr05CG16850 [Ipomoea trifida]